MSLLTMRDRHTHPHRWERRPRLVWSRVFITVLMTGALLLTVYGILFHR